MFFLLFFDPIAYFCFRDAGKAPAFLNNLIITNSLKKDNKKNMTFSTKDKPVNWQFY